MNKVYEKAPPYLEKNLKPLRTLHFYISITIKYQISFFQIGGDVRNCFHPPLNKSGHWAYIRE